MARPVPELVHYVAYGSNLDPSRFGCYLAGGTPVGASRTYLGCRDRRPPLEAVPVTIPHRLSFVGYSSIWDGSFAVVDSDADAGVATLAVAYLVRAEQFFDVVAQENGGEAPGAAFDLPAAGTAAAVDVTGVYDVVVGLDPVDGRGIDAVTFTTSRRFAAGAPSSSYAAVIAAGLGAHHDLGLSDAARYLHRVVHNGRVRGGGC
jgi:hypothetical protein